MKTELAKIMSVSGQHGLFRFVAQARGGALAESLETGKRTVFSGTSRITTLADIAIYTSEGELKLREVFEALAKTLDGKPSAGSKASESEIKDIFLKAVPNYDGDRFYLSHMKKVLDWYNELQKYASLEFTDGDEESDNKESRD